VDSLSAGFCGHYTITHATVINSKKLAAMFTSHYRNKPAQLMQIKQTNFIKQ